MNFRVIFLIVIPFLFLLVEIVFKGTETVVSHMHLECKLKFKNYWIDL